MNTDLDGLLEFLFYVSQAKQTFRTGWIVHNVEKVENVADHMYRMAVMSLLLPTLAEESKVRCMKLALVHDLSESVVGNLTEFDGLLKNVKHRREIEAMLYLTSLLPADIGREIFSLFNEYAEQKTYEAKLVKDLDLFDMFLQAYEYEQSQNENEYFEDIFSNSTSNIQTDLVQQWFKQLIDCRLSGKQFQLPSESNLNTILKHILYNEQGLHFVFKQKFVFGTDLRSKFNSSTLTSTQLLTNLVKEIKHQQN